MKFLSWLVPSWLYLGLAFGGESETSTETYQQDNRRVIGEGSVSAEDSTVNLTNITTNQNLGGEVVDASLNFAGDTVFASLGTVSKAVDQALTFGSDALSGALQFGTTAIVANANLADATIAAADRARASADRTASSALDIARDSFGDAFNYSAKATGAAYDALGQNASFVKDAYADAKGRGALTDKILIAAVIAVAVVAYGAVRK